MFAKSLVTMAAAAALAAVATAAGQEFGIINENGLTEAGLRLLPDEAADVAVPVEAEAEAEPVPVKLTCKDRAQKPGDACYFRSHVYMAKTKEEKMSELWAEILKDDEPMEYYWTSMPNFFTQRSNGSFCQRSDTLSKKRLKTTHT